MQRLDWVRGSTLKAGDKLSIKYQYPPYSELKCTTAIVTPSMGDLSNEGKITFEMGEPDLDPLVVVAEDNQFVVAIAPDELYQKFLVWTTWYELAEGTLFRFKEGDGSTYIRVPFGYKAVAEVAVEDTPTIYKGNAATPVVRLAITEVEDA